MSLSTSQKDGGSGAKKGKKKAQVERRSYYLRIEVNNSTKIAHVPMGLKVVCCGMTRKESGKYQARGRQFLGPRSEGGWSGIEDAAICIGGVWLQHEGRLSIAYHAATVP